jgi:hypothetical protein
MGRILIAGIAGGIAMFIWGALAHVVLPLGTMGIQQMPNEDFVMAAMKGSIERPGLYFFPAIDMKKASPEQQKAWQTRYAEGPTGILVYHPTGEQPMSPRMLGTEVFTNILAALIAALLVSWTTAGYGGRVFLVVLMGLFSWITISVPYWNWYGFPGDFTLAEGIDQAVGALVAGLVIAALVKPKHRLA